MNENNGPNRLYACFFSSSFVLLNELFLSLPLLLVLLLGRSGMMTMNHIVFEYIKVNLNCFASILLYTHKTCSIALPHFLSSFGISPAHAQRTFSFCLSIVPCEKGILEVFFSLSLSLDAITILVAQLPLFRFEMLNAIR